MRKLTKVVALVLLVVAAAFPISAKMACEAGGGVYSPISGEIADCLEGGGDDCLSCTVRPNTR